jgi:hypothetical protein
MRKVTVLIMLLLGAAAVAQQNYPRDITLSWTAPVLYVDGTAIQQGDLKETRIYCERNDGSVVIDEAVPMIGGPGDPQEYVFSGAIPQPGTYTCTSFAVTIDDISSDASDPATIKYTGKPQPPGNMSSRK